MRPFRIVLDGEWVATPKDQKGRRRIVFVNRFFHPDLSATSQMLSDLAFHLGSQGWQVTVVTSRQLYDDPRTVLPSREEIRGVDVHRVWTPRFDRHRLPLRLLDYLMFVLGALARLIVLDTRGAIVVTKTDPPLVSLVGAVAVAARGGTLINWVQDVFPEVAERLHILKPGGVGSRVARWARRTASGRAMVNVVVGEGMATTLAEESETVRVLANWADGREIQPIDSRSNPLRREWALDETFVVGYSGNLGRAHDHATLLEATRHLRTTPDVRFLMIGGGPGMELMRKAAAEEELENVRFEAYQPRSALGNSLGVPDVHVVSLLPALEGLVLPSKIYGIAAAGRPTILIGDPRGDVARLLERHDCGVVVEPGDTSGLVRSILGMKREVCLRERMGRNARRAFEAHYDAPIALRGWEDLLLDVLDRGSSPWTPKPTATQRM